MQLRRDGLSWHVAGDEVVVLDLEGSVYLKLNGSARVLWEALSESCSQSDLADLLVERYGVDPAVAESDAAEFVGQLRERQLLEG